MESEHKCFFPKPNRPRTRCALRGGYPSARSSSSRSFAAECEVLTLVARTCSPHSASEPTPMPAACSSVSVNRQSGPNIRAKVSGLSLSRYVAYRDWQPALRDQPRLEVAVLLRFLHNLLYCSLVIFITFWFFALADAKDIHLSMERAERGTNYWQVKGFDDSKPYCFRNHQHESQF
jgi:hypothetical protein